MSCKEEMQQQIKQRDEQENLHDRQVLRDANRRRRVGDQRQPIILSVYSPKVQYSKPLMMPTGETQNAEAGKPRAWSQAEIYNQPCMNQIRVQRSSCLGHLCKILKKSRCTKENNFSSSKKIVVGGGVRKRIEEKMIGYGEDVLTIKQIK